MPGSKYERELRFIDTETARLNYLKTQLMESMPADPAEAAEKLSKVQEMEEQIANYLERKKEIEDSFVSVGLDVPNIHKSMNASVYNRISDEFEAVPPTDSFSYSSYSLFNKVASTSDSQRPVSKPVPEVKPIADVDEIDLELNGIAQELIELEMKLMRAEVVDDQDEMAKIKAAINLLRERRDSLIQQVKELKMESEKPSQIMELEKRIADLESDVKSLRSQISLIRSNTADIMEKVRQIAFHLNIEEDD